MWLYTGYISRKQADAEWINLILIESWRNPALLLCETFKCFAFRSDKKQKRKTLLHDVSDRFFKSRLAREPRKILQWCEWQADKDRDAGRGEKHPFFRKSSQTDEGAIRDIC